MKIKTTITFIFLTFVFTCITLRALYIQVINKEKLMSYSKSQIVREAKIYPKRGFILDRSGNPLAINVQRYNLFTFGKDSKLLARELRKLKRIVPAIQAKKVLNQAIKRSKFTWVDRKIELSEEQVEKIKQFKTILVEPITSRFYPNHELLSQSLGFVGIDNDGLAGIEYYFNDHLKGEAEVFKYFKDAKGRPVKFKSKNFNQRAQDIELSIDKDIQASMEKYLAEAVKEFDADSAGAAVMDASSGEIWAMANYPSFDPNGWKAGDKKKLSFITDPFEPGSIMKTITVASALENKIVRPDTNFYCERGRLRIGKHVITESDSNHRHEWLSVSDILRLSSNVGTTKIAFDLTYPKLKETLKLFNFGEKTGIEISGESRGIVDFSENISPIRLSNISFGQGIATSGIQMLAAYAVFANGGHYVRPTILKKTIDTPIKSKRIVSKKTVDEINKMLVDAVENGTGTKAQIPHFTIAGKTSTAQRPDKMGGYSGYVSGFIGYPVDIDKKFVVFVYVDNPKKEYYGNTVAAPVFKKIIKKILYKDKAYMKLAKSKHKRKSFDKLNIRYSARKKIERGKMPDLKGLDKRTASKLLDEMNLVYESKGFGVIYKQYPKAGTDLSQLKKVKIYFKAPNIQ
mgnify:CR=1 FL=1